MPKFAPKVNGPTSSARMEPYSKTSPRDQGGHDKENVNPSRKSGPSSSNHIDWRDNYLEEVFGEVPCYDNAATVRRKLNKLINDKALIPGSSKKFTKAAMAEEMQELEERSPPVQHRNRNNNGPTVNSLGTFLKKSGNMGGGDSPCYYWGYVLVEKLRIYNGEKKTKARLEIEKS